MRQSTCWESKSYFYLVKTFPAIHEILRFIIFFTLARHLHLSCARWTQSKSYHFMSLKSVLTHSFHLRVGLPRRLFYSEFPTDILYKFIFCLIHATLFSVKFFFFHPPNKIWWQLQIVKSFIMQFSPSSFYFLFLRPKFHS